jgi:hypothetical protein
MPKAWHLLVAICFGMPVAAAFSYAAVRRADALGYALLIPLSVMLGFACAWLLDTVRTRVGAHVIRPFGSIPGWFFAPYEIARFARSRSVQVELPFKTVQLLGGLRAFAAARAYAADGLAGALFVFVGPHGQVRAVEKVERVDQPGR